MADDLFAAIGDLQMGLPLGDIPQGDMPYVDFVDHVERNEAARAAERAYFQQLAKDLASCTSAPATPPPLFLDSAA